MFHTVIVEKNQTTYLIFYNFFFPKTVSFMSWRGKIL